MTFVRALSILCCLMAGCTLVPPVDGGRALVFFQTWSADLDESALRSIRSVATVARLHPNYQIWVEGYADLTGSVAANKLISETRAQVVADTLLKEGVSAGQIRQLSFGQVGTAQHSQESRRVVLITESNP